MRKAKTRVWSIVLTLAMLLSLLPVSAMAVGDTRAGEAGNPLTNTSNNITVNKYVSGNATGGYSLTLEAYAANQQTTTTTTTPLDIVLVLDVSGSMADPISYTAASQTSWSYNDIKDSGTTYYYRDRDGNYYEVEAETGGLFRTYYYLYYTNDWNIERTISSGRIYSPDEPSYSGPLYTAGELRIVALKNAVASFINSVAANASENSVDHQISIVKFAGDSKAEIGNDKYQDGSYTYNYSQIVKGLTSVFDGGSSELITAVNGLEAMGATRADYGMEHAQTVLQGARDDSHKVVIMFTDGSPTSGQNFEADVANAAISASQTLKSSDVTVYTIGIFEGADPSGNSNENLYMNAVSSNYPNATSYTNLGTRAEGTFYFASSTSSGLEGVFNTIADTVTSNTLTANPDSEAVLSDTLSQYFEFPARLSGSSSEITVKYAPATHYDTVTKTFTFGQAEDLPGGSNVEVSIAGGTISVTGFNYKEYAASYNSTGTVSGGKLIVTFPIEVNEDACILNPTPNGIYPTNSTASGSEAGLSYKGDSEAQSNDTSTSLTRSPDVTLTDLDANGTDVTVQVYVDGKKVADPLNYIELSRNTKDTTYFYFSTSVSDGIVTCDFNYQPGRHDCVDLNVKILAPGSYVLQGVRSYQSYGMSGTSNVSEGMNADTYIVDNVTADNTDAVDCTIYLRSAYSVEYYRDSIKLTEEPYNDQNTYIAGTDISETTAEGPTEGNSAWMSWKNDKALTSISLPALPSVTGSDVDGWFLGSASGTEYDPSGSVNMTDAVPSAESSVIKFYATSSAKNYNLTYKWSGLPAGATITPPDDESYAYGAPVTIDNIYTSSSTTKVGHDTYTFSGWTSITPDLGADSTMPASDVTVSGTWEKTSSDPKYTVEYKVTGDAPATSSELPAEAQYYEGDPVTVAGGLTTDETTKDSVSGTWTFSGWTTEDAEIAEGAFIMPDKGVTLTGTWSFEPDTHNITINYQDDVNTVLKPSYTDTQNDGSEYSFDVSKEDGAIIPFIIVKDDTNYVFDHFADSTPLSGELTDDVVITAVYLIDANGNKVPDAYEATVTYKVVKGTWADDTNVDKTEGFVLKTFDPESNSWVAATPTPTLDDTIPTGMKPDANHTGSGEWDTAISADTKVTGDVTYTYTFSTEKAPVLTVDKTVTSVGGTAVSDQSSIPSATVGDVIEYQIAVENTGNVALSDVTVSDGKWESGVEIKVGGEATTLTGGSYTITSLDVGKSVTITYSYTVTDADVTAGKVTNNVTADDGNDTEDDDTVEVPVSGTITITPANITIYMGGDEGYDAVVGENAQTTSSNSMPTPLFYVTVPSSLGNVDVSDIVLTGDGGREWKFEFAGYDSAGKALYYINSTGFTDQEPVRVTYTGSDGHAHISDSFNPSAVNDLFTTYEIAIYAGGAGKVEANVNGVRYGIATGTGKLYVRAVEDTEDNPVVSVETTVTEPVASGEAAIFAPADTKYTLNNTSVEVDPEGVGLLFDSIIDTDADRTGALIDAIESEYNINITNGNYQAQYLDLVDANNGNAWVKADGNVTVYWGYPKGTNSSTSFTLYHFTDLHRDGSNSGFDIADISNSDIEVVKVTKTTYGIAFEVEPGGFSPFVLVWSDNYIPPIVPPSEPDYTPNWLNTTDHFGYIIGYEDGTMKPNAGITRAEVATIFFRLLTDEARERFWCETNAYTDVADGSWYNNAISTLSNIGILGGYEDGTFRPNASITRAEFAKIAVSFFDWADIEAANNFVDVRDSAWYANYVAVAAKIGLIEGYGGNVFRPDATITRAEACTIINRTLGRAPDADHLLPVGQMNTWPDNSDTSVWYYAQIQEATNSHNYRWIGDIEQWTAKLPEPDWDKLQY